MSNWMHCPFLSFCSEKNATDLFSSRFQWQACLSMNTVHSPLIDVLNTIEMRCREQLRESVQEMCRNYESFLEDIMDFARQEWLTHSKLANSVGEALSTSFQRHEFPCAFYQVAMLVWALVYAFLSWISSSYWKFVLIPAGSSDERTLLVCFFQMAFVFKDVPSQTFGLSRN